MNQFSNLADTILDRLSVEIGEAEKKIEEGEKEKDNAWVEIFDLFDEFGKEDKEARFIASDGHTLSRQMRQRTSKLDSDAVKRAVFDFYNTVIANRVWNSITDRVVNPEKLSEALLHGKISIEAVKDLLPKTTTAPARVRTEWTKEDKERAAIFGIRSEQA